MKLTIAALAASAALMLTPIGAFAQHVDVGPGGIVDVYELDRSAWRSLDRAREAEAE